MSLTVLLVLASCKGGDEGPAAKPSAADAGEVAIAVDVAVATRGRLARAATTTGVVQAAKQASLRAETGGRVVEVKVEDGMRVAKGDLLVRIDDTRQSIAVAGAKAQLAAVREDLAYAKKELERKQRLSEKGSIASAALDAAEYQKAKAEAGVATADANLRSARRSLADTRVYAPFDGIASSVMIDVGDTTAPGAPLADIFDLAQVEVRVGLAGLDPRAGVGHVLEVLCADVGADRDDHSTHVERVGGLRGGDGLGLAFVGVGLLAGIGLAVGGEDDHDLVAWVLRLMLDG